MTSRKAAQGIALSVLTSASLLGSLALAPTASAATSWESGCTRASYLNANTWGYRVCDAPDIDQGRAGAPGDGGSYCAPAASLNALFWLDKHGYPNLLTGDYDPTSSADPDYSEVTAKMIRMGERMDTDSPGGTTTDDLIDGVRSLVEEKGYGSRISVLSASFEDDDKDAASISRTLVALTNGGRGMLVARLGRYDDDGDRVSGHFVTVVGAEGGKNTTAYRPTVILHNPAGGGDIRTQSETTSDSHTLGANDGNGPAITRYGSPAVTVRLEGVVAIMPNP
ncbi:hypothetical protein [Streptomyces sp. NPDC059828]|uniref:hypothetical protein n=1 Tax=Streptomyces sp. NPDC059828 TaxID=3346965 RepID=UPI00364AA266